MMISGFSMTFMLSAPLGNPMMDAFSCSTQKMLVALSTAPASPRSNNDIS
jgi:hypothetical protein